MPLLEKTFSNSLLSQLCCMALTHRFLYPTFSLTGFNKLIPQYFLALGLIAFLTATHLTARLSQPQQVL